MQICKIFNDFRILFNVYKRYFSFFNPCPHYILFSVPPSATSSSHPKSQAFLPFPDFYPQETGNPRYVSTHPESKPQQKYPLGVR